MLETWMMLCVIEADFPEKKFCCKYWVNGPNMGQKLGFLNLVKNLVFNFYWISSIMKIYIICCVPAWKFLHEIWAKMFSGNQIAGFFNQSYIQNKWLKWPDFLHVDANSHELTVDQNILGGHGQKWVWPIWSRDSTIDCISRMSRCNELIFCMLVQIQES